MDQDVLSAKLPDSSVESELPADAAGVLYDDRLREGGAFSNASLLQRSKAASTYSTERLLAYTTKTTTVGEHGLATKSWARMIGTYPWLVLALTSALVLCLAAFSQISPLKLGYSFSIPGAKHAQMNYAYLKIRVSAESQHHQRQSRGVTLLELIYTSRSGDVFSRQNLRTIQKFEKVVLEQDDYEEICLGSALSSSEGDNSSEFRCDSHSTISNFVQHGGPGEEDDASESCVCRATGYWSSTPCLVSDTVRQEYDGLRPAFETALILKELCASSSSSSNSTTENPLELLCIGGLARSKLEVTTDAMDCENGKSKIAKSTFYVGLPLAQYDSMDDRYDDQLMKVNEFRGGVYGKLYALAERQFLKDRDLKLFIVDHGGAAKFWLDKSLLWVLIGSLVMGHVFKTKANSFAVSVYAGLMVSVSFLAGLAIFATVDTSGYNTVLASVGYFLLLGLGADDVCFYVDTWNRSEILLGAGSPHRQRLEWTFAHCAGGIVYTTLTTAIAYGVCAFSPIWDIRCFALVNFFASLILLFLCLTGLPAILLIASRGDFTIRSGSVPGGGGFFFKLSARCFCGWTRGDEFSELDKAKDFFAPDAALDELTAVRFLEDIVARVGTNQLAEWFRECDTDTSGEIDFFELVEGARRVNIDVTTEQTARLGTYMETRTLAIRRSAVTKNGTLSKLPRFLSVEERLVEAHAQLKSELLRLTSGAFRVCDTLEELFCGFDADGSGSVDLDEFTDALISFSVDLSAHELVLLKAYLDKDGTFTFGLPAFLAIGSGAVIDTRGMNDRLLMVERFFSETLWRRFYKRFALPLALVALVATVAVTVSTFFVITESHVGPATYVDGHYTTRSAHRLDRFPLQHAGYYRLAAALIYGVESDRAFAYEHENAVISISSNIPAGRVQYDEGLDLQSNQHEMVAACAVFRDSLERAGILSSAVLSTADDDASYCFMSDFEKWCDVSSASRYAFPVNATSFVRGLQDWNKSPLPHGRLYLLLERPEYDTRTGYVLDESSTRVKAAYAGFASDVNLYESPDLSSVEHLAAISRSSLVDVAARTGAANFKAATSNEFEAAEIGLRRVVSATFVNLGYTCCAVVICITTLTMNWMISLIGALSLASMVFTSVLIFMTVAGNTLGINESICIIVSGGICADYIVHVIHCYADAKGNSRQRVQSALAQTGWSLISSSATTFTAACLLVFASFGFWRQIGTFVAISCAVSIVQTFLVLVPLLVVFGPNDDQGMIRFERPRSLARRFRATEA